jgi:hypothetical protein
VIEQSQIQGEPGTGYEPPEIRGKDLGDFNCYNCRFFNPGNSGCRQKTMMEKSKQPRLENGQVEVDEMGCCEYIHRASRPRRTVKQETSSFKKRWVSR